MSVTAKILILILLILGSSFFALSEISLAASSKVRLQRKADNGDACARKVLATKDNPGYFISVVQIGLNMFAILGGIVGEGAFTPYFAIPLGYVMSPEMAMQGGFILSFISITVALVIFADLVPKRFALLYPEKIILTCYRPMSLFITLLKPLVWFLERSSAMVLHILGISTDKKEKITSDDVLASVMAGADAGVIEREEQAVIENVFDLGNRLVTTAMTARESVTFFSLSSTEEAVHKMVSENTFQHYLVCDKDLDHVVGYVESNELLRHLLEGKKISFRDQSLVQPVQMVPDTLSLSEVLKLFQRTSTDFAVVLNEYALVVGIITLHDIMSSVMGDLVITAEESQIVERDENSWLVDGATPIIDMMHFLDWDEMPESQSYETMAGFMMYMLRKIPKRTDKVDWNGYRFEVMDVEANRIDQILVTKL